VWLTVRIVNRRERWAKRLAVAMAVIVVYPLSFGPACWLSSRINVGAAALGIAYQPLVWVIASDWRAAIEGESQETNLIRIGHALERYAQFGAADDWMWHPHYGEVGYDGWIWSRIPSIAVSPVY
jgi:hypothetical protein